MHSATISASHARISIRDRALARFAHTYVHVRAHADAHKLAEMCSARKYMHERGLTLERGTAVIPIHAKCARDRQTETEII